MKIEWKEDNFDFDDINNEETETRAPDDKRKTAEKYNDEMARDAVAGLFDTGEIYPPEDERPVRKTPPRVPYKPKTARAPGPRVQDLIDGNEEEPALPRKRDRTYESNPVPRPAVKIAASPKERNHAARPASTRYEDYDDYDDESDVEEEMDAFRSRYKSTRPKPRARSEERPEPSRRSDRLNYDTGADAEEERLPLMRIIYIGSVILLLGITVFFAYRYSAVSNQLTVVQEKLDNLPEGGGFDETIARDRMSEMQKEIDDLKSENELLRNETDEPQFGPDETPDPAGLTNPDGANTSAEGSDEPAAPTENQSYTAVRGDSLSKIAQKFYGSQSPDYVKKIKDANNKTDDGIQEGEVFVIPPK